MKMINKTWFWFIVLVFLASCQPPPSEPPPVGEPKPLVETSLEPASWSEIQGVFASDVNLQTWAGALEQSAVYYQRLSATAPLKFGSRKVDASVMLQATRALAKAARTMKGADFERWLTDEYQLLRSTGSDQNGQVLVTAYYEPLLHGSLKRSKKYHFPLYRRPDDLLEADLGDWYADLKGKRLVARLDAGRLTPYYDRAEIDRKKKLESRGLELVWVDDVIDAFFLQIQGSGRVLLENGEVLRVGYHSANGRPYRAIGKLLIEEKEISKENMGLPALREWLTQHPDQIERVLEYNPSYVFFKRIEGGPEGNIAVPLTAWRSIATDHRLFPKGAPGILKTTLPVFEHDGKTVRQWRDDVRFVVNQDTGGAIRGPGRVDLFTGFGDEAERVAGIMKSEGSALYFIMPK
ncbi:MAG: MltA domain-containing protein [Magnetococcales bacterium]|nr:MltA domain-containing protein [Magnetococcales bacterium]MBF0348112.1 MltA domain-containing protein [Magnetococcales bacterium]